MTARILIAEDEESIVASLLGEFRRHQVLIMHSSRSGFEICRAMAR